MGAGGLLATQRHWVILFSTQKTLHTSLRMISMWSKELILGNNKRCFQGVMLLIISLSDWLHSTCCMLVCLRNTPHRSDRVGPILQHVEYPWFEFGAFQTSFRADQNTLNASHTAGRYIGKIFRATQIIRPKSEPGHNFKAVRRLALLLSSKKVIR